MTFLKRQLTGQRTGQSCQDLRAGEGNPPGLPEKPWGAGTSRILALVVVTQTVHTAMLRATQDRK